MLWMMGYDYDHVLLELDNIDIAYDSKSDNNSSTNSDTSVYDNDYSNDKYGTAIDI